MDYDVNELIRLLIEARRLNNQTCRSSKEVTAWHKAVDLVVAGTEHDDPTERYDDAHRTAHRDFVEGLFRK
jgi:hypothetical protein